MTPAEERRFVARHEAGHYVTATVLGAKNVTVNDLHTDRPYVDADWRAVDDAAAIDDEEWATTRVAYLRAGRYAAGSGDGCAADDAAERGVLRTLPWRRWARVREAGDRLSRQLVCDHAGEIAAAARWIEGAVGPPATAAAGTGAAPTSHSSGGAMSGSIEEVRAGIARANESGNEALGASQQMQASLESAQASLLRATEGSGQADVTEANGMYAQAVAAVEQARQLTAAAMSASGDVSARL